MGCGQSAMGLRWRGGGTRSNHSGSEPGSEDDADETANVTGGSLETVDACGGFGNSAANAAAATAAKLRQITQNAPGPGPLLPRAEISSSQLDFFKMLDSKIESGQDYDPEDAEERINEEARVRDLLRTWESAAASAAAAAAVAAVKATPTHSAVSAPHSTSISLAGSSNNSAASSPRHSDMAHSNGAADLYVKRYTSREYVQWQQQQSTAHQYVQQYHQQYYQQYQYQQHYPQPYQHQYYQFLTTPPSPKSIPLLSHQSSVGSPVLERTAKVPAGSVPSATSPASAAAGSPQRQLHHHLANSIVQYKKCGGTRTELL